MNDENGNPIRGHDLGCAGTEQLHWFCSPCIANLWSCPIFPATALTLHSSAAARNASQKTHAPHTAHPDPAKRRNNGAGGDTPDVEWLDVLTDEAPTTPPPHPPWRAPTWALPVEGADPTT